MAINSYEGVQIKFKSSFGRFKYDKLGESSSTTSTLRSKSNIKRYTKSPYLNDDVSLISKGIARKRHVDASPPGVYKVNSDKLNSRRKYKNVKKSVLTLPSDPAPKPQECTVSDMNESDYFNYIDEDCKVKSKRRLLGHKPPQKNNTKILNNRPNYDCSSTDLSKTSKIFPNKKKVRNSQFMQKSKNEAENSNAHDVWSMLRQMNWFQHRPSPPMSEDSVVMVQSQKTSKRKQGSKERRIYKTQQSEEFALIKLNSVYGSCSQTSSFDRMTVIDKEDNLNQIYESFETSHYNGERPNSKTKKKPLRKPIKTKMKLKSFDTLENKQNFESSEQNTNSNFCNKVKGHKIVEYGSGEVNSQADFCTKKTALVRNKSVNDKQIINNYDDFGTFFDVNNSGSSKAASKYSENADKESQVNFNSEQKHEPKKYNFTKENLKRSQLSQSTKKGNAKSVKENILPKTKHYSNKRAPSPEIRRQQLEVKFPIVFVGKDDRGSSTTLAISEGDSLLSLINKPDQKTKYPYSRKGETGSTRKGSINNVGLKENGISLKITSPKFEIQKRNLHFDQVDEETKESKIIANRLSLEKTKSIIDYIEIKVGKKAGTILKNFVETNNESSQTNQNCNNLHLMNQNTLNSKKKLLNVKLPNNKFSWAKTRAVNDFVDNVINKTISGVYYSGTFTENQVIVSSKLRAKSPNFTKPLLTNTKNQVEKVKISNDNDLNIDNVDSNQAMKEIIGINRNVKKIEIDTFVTDQISIKDLHSNVIVQFDINIAINPSFNRDKTKSLIFESVFQENKTKVFKYKRAIVNSTLPAEICTLLPEIMDFITNTNNKSHCVALLPKAGIKDSSNELLHQCDYKESVNSDNRAPLFGLGLLDGCFNKNCIKTITPNLIPQRESYVSKCILFLGLPKCLLPQIIVNPRNVIANRRDIYKPKSGLIKTTSNHRSNAIQPFMSNNKHMDCSFGSNNKGSQKFKYFVTLQTNALTRDITISLISLNENKNSSLSLTFKKDLFENEMSTSDIISKYRGKLNRIKNEGDEFNSKCIEYGLNHNGSFNTAKTKDLNSYDGLKFFCKPKIMSSKCNYQKRQSTASIIEQKRHLTLSKINNLEDFFKILGPAKMFVNIFDGHSESRILSYIKEIKCWVKKINLTQAMLILLLANKNETRTLLQYRFVILQGIAVQRITTATELEMETEVLEKEKPNIRKFESITNYTNTTEKQSNIFEELLWIAKTTASDHQKTFNESSVKLLRSLLQKRKKLSPSYLRVMARYVGLGLLKPVKE